MTDYLRIVLLAALCLLAGCTVAVTDGGTATPARDTGTLTVQSPDGANATLDFAPADRIEVRVVAVVDGDTIDVRLPDGTEDTVRLVGVDTPEVHVENDPAEFEGVPETDAGAACLRAAGVNASRYVETRLHGETVTLLFDPNTDRRGGYGRLLAHVSHDGTNVNYALVATGRARVYDSEFVLRETFDAAETAARDAGRGLWRCQTPP